jgi:hypothetical protein
MNDALKNPSHDLTLKLHWPSDQDQLADVPWVVVELQGGAGLRLASVSVPSEELMQAVAQKLAHCPLISPDGFVSVNSDDVRGVLPKGNAIPLDQLVAEAISPEMLEDEPEAAQMLSKFRLRLLKSLELVEQAIAALPKP